MCTLHIWKYVLTPLAESILVPLGLLAGAFSNRCSYSKQNLWIWHYNISVSNEDLNDIIKIGKSLEESCLS